MADEKREPEIKFEKIEVATWPNPGYDEVRFGVWFTINGLLLHCLKKQSSWPELLRALANQMEKEGFNG